MRPARSSVGTGGSMSALWRRDSFGDPSPVGPLVALDRTPAWTSQRQFRLRRAPRWAVGRVLRVSVLAPGARRD